MAGFTPVVWSGSIVEANKHTFKNEEEISASSKVVCAYCGRLYDPEKYKPEMVEEHDGQRTAFCHFCPVDALLGNFSGLPISDETFLKECCADWFAGQEVQLIEIE